MDLRDFLPRFNPGARIEAVPLDPVHLPGKLCLVVDDFVFNPQAMVALAVIWRDHFQAPATAPTPGWSCECCPPCRACSTSDSASTCGPCSADDDRCASTAGCRW
jgi:hypothetical protein